MVEQLGVGGRPAPGAEVVGRGDQPPAEVVLPDPVDHDPGGQGVRRVDQPAGQLQPAALLGRDALGQPLAAEDLEEAPGDHLAGAGGVALPEEWRVVRRSLGDGVGLLDRGRVGVEFLQPRL